MSKGRNTTVIGVRLPDELVSQIDSKCKKLGISRSEFMLKATRDQLRVHVAKKSAAVPAPDLLEHEYENVAIVG